MRIGIILSFEEYAGMVTLEQHQRILANLAEAEQTIVRLHKTITQLRQSHETLSVTVADLEEESARRELKKL